MDQVTKLLMDTARRLFAEGCEHELQESVEEGRFPRSLWEQIEENGLTMALVDEEQGGVGLDLAAAGAVLRTAGAFALPLPLAETMLGARLLSGAGLDVPEGPLLVAPAGAGSFRVEDGIVGSARGLPWLAGDGHVVVVTDGASAEVALFRVSDLTTAVSLLTNPAGELRADLDLDGSVEPVVRASSDLDSEWLLHTGAVLRVAQMAGALDRLLDLCIEHATGRVQFGRPVAKFQAVQNLIAVLAGEAAAIGVSAPAAVRAWQDGADRLAVAAAKCRAGEAAGTASRIAHQVHAAIGYTREHILHRFTRRLWSWRDDFLDEGHWAARVGAETIRVGGDGLWPRITARG